MRNLFIGLAFFGIFAAAVADPRDFTVDVKPVFQGVTTWPSAPVAIEIENKGPDARGQLLLSVEGETTRYPVELPTGSKKRIVAYPSNSPYGLSPEWVLDTNQGRFEIPYTPKGSYNYGNTAVVALISDTAGDLGFLRQNDQRQNSESQFSDTYCTPEEAPERPVGYQGLSAVILGPGADRMSDRARKALESYVLTGGTIIFVGGASATVLNDPRWVNVLPARGFQTATVARSQILGSLAPLNESITVASGSPIHSAKVRRDGQVAMILERGYGIGRVVTFAFNPFEEPLVRWSARKKLFGQFIRNLDSQRASIFLNQFDTTNSYDPYGNSYAVSTTGGTTYYSSGSGSFQQRQDPFNVQLPAPSKVFWILAAFFVAVVPINFFVLRKLGKGEWAWVTAPVISLSFAGVFLNQASDLYSASLSTATRGALIVQDGASEAMFVGNTQIFFPNGGSYDLKMENVDQLGSGTNNEYGYRRDQNRTQVNPVDVGTIRIPDLRAANLAFEEIGYRQRFDKTPRLQVQVTDSSDRGHRITVKNTTSSRLNNAALIVAGRRYGLQPLAPGSEQSLTVESGPAKTDNNGDYLIGFSARQRVAIVVADLDGLRPGPQIGAEVTGRSSVRMIYVAPIPFGAND